MVNIITIKDHTSYNIRNLDDLNNSVSGFYDSLKYHSIKDQDPKDAINDIIKVLFNLQDEINSNNIDTFIIRQTGTIQYCLFTYRYDKLTDEDTIISRLIDNSVVVNYTEDISLHHNNICVICKIDGKNVLDITKDEVLDIIKNSYLTRAIIIEEGGIYAHYYHNNPVYDLEGFDVYVSFKFGEKNMMVFLDIPEKIEFEEYENINVKNKNIYKGLFDKWKVFKEQNKFPKGCKMLISLHENNININVNKEIEEKIIKFLSE